MATRRLPALRSSPSRWGGLLFVLGVACSPPDHSTTRVARAAADDTPNAPDTRAGRETLDSDTLGRDTLVICADPNNLPYSTRDGRGFELILAKVVADELRRPLAVHWRAQRRGVVREALNTGLCDVMPGTVASGERSLNTRPYYRSTYVFVTRRNGPAAARTIATLDDPALRTLRIGVHMVGDDYTNTPPAHALASRGIVRNVVGYSLYGDYSLPDPPLMLLRAVSSGEIDLAIVWGPFAGWAAQRDSALVWRAVSPAIDLPFLPFVYDIAMGVRRGDTALRDSLDAILVRRAFTVDSLLRAYGVPRVDRLPATAAGVPSPAP
jgi:mxaJ protein